MDSTTISELVNSFCTVYKNRGFITVDEIQDKLDQCGASFLETNQVMYSLEERGCKISEASGIEDLSFYDGTYEDTAISISKRFSEFLKKEKVDDISGLDFSLRDYEEGLLYYIYLRVTMKLSKAATIHNIMDLQDGYLSALSFGEYKIVFDIQSAEYMQTILNDLMKSSMPIKKKRNSKSAIFNYQYFLTLNKHTVIANCESRLKS